jgi:hypothetical protein
MNISNMENSPMKKQFLDFMIALITCIFLGYLFHDLTYGILGGIGAGIGICMGNRVRERRNRMKQKET